MHANAYDLGIEFTSSGSYKCTVVKCAKHAGIEVLEAIETVKTPVTMQLKRLTSERCIVCLPRKGKEGLEGKLMYYSPLSKIFCIVSHNRQVRWIDESKVIEALGYEIGGRRESPSLVLKHQSSNSGPPPVNLPPSSTKVPSPVTSPSMGSKRKIKNETVTDGYTKQKRLRAAGPTEAKTTSNVLNDNVSSSNTALPSEQIEEGGRTSRDVVLGAAESSEGDRTTIKRRDGGGNEAHIPAVSLVTSSSSPTATSANTLSENVDEWRFHGMNNGSLIAGLSMATSIQKVELKTSNGQPIYFVQPCMVSPVLHLPTAEPLCERFHIESEQPDSTSVDVIRDNNMVERLGDSNSSTTLCVSSVTSNRTRQFASEATTTAKQRGSKDGGSSDMASTTDYSLPSSTADSSRDDRYHHHLLPDSQKREQGGGSAANDRDKNRFKHSVSFSSTVSSHIRDPRLASQRSSATSSSNSNSSSGMNKLPISRTLSLDDPRVSAQPPKERTTGLGKK